MVHVWSGSYWIIKPAEVKQSDWNIHRFCSLQIPTYLLWSSMLLIVYNNIKLYNVREHRIHLADASAIGCVQNVHCICESFEGIMYNQVYRCFKKTSSDHSVCTLLSGNIIDYLIDWSIDWLIDYPVPDPLPPCSVGCYR